MIGTAILLDAERKNEIARIRVDLAFVANRSMIVYEGQHYHYSNFGHVDKQITYAACAAPVDIMSLPHAEVVKQ